MAGPSRSPATDGRTTRCTSAAPANNVTVVKAAPATTTARCCDSASVTRKNTHAAAHDHSPANAITPAAVGFHAAYAALLSRAVASTTSSYSCGGDKARRGDRRSTSPLAIPAARSVSSGASTPSSPTRLSTQNVRRSSRSVGSPSGRLSREPINRASSGTKAATETSAGRATSSWVRPPSTDTRI